MSENETETEIKIIPVAEEYVAGVMTLCELEGWTSFLESREKTWKALTAPGVTTLVAARGPRVVGFAQLQTDGTIQAHLSNIAVDADLRRQGVATRLIEEAFARSGATRIDLLSTEGSDAFYESFEHRVYRGYRIYPQVSGGGQP